MFSIEVCVYIVNNFIFCCNFMKRQNLCCFLLSSLEEAEDDFQAENIPEAMKVDNVPEATVNEERIAMLEAELEREQQKSVSLQN